MKYTNAMKINGELAARNLSDRARRIYDITDPFDIYEYEIDEGTRYAYTGGYGEAINLTFEQLNNELEEFANIVCNAAGDEIDFPAAVQLMDDEIRERLHNELAPCTDQEFFDAYCEAHEEKYGEEFEPAKEISIW